MDKYNKYKDNALVVQMDAIILLNDNYEEQGLKKGYIGVVALPYDEQLVSEGLTYLRNAGKIKLRLLEFKQKLAEASALRAGNGTHTGEEVRNRNFRLDKAVVNA